MKRDSWIVGDYSIRPAGSPDKCFYCGELKGQPHKPECVIRSKTVVIRLAVEYTIDVPESWTEEDIEFHRNEGGWCADNALSEIGNILDRTGDCLCSLSVTEYVREATPEDEKKDGVFVEELPA